MGTKKLQKLSDWKEFEEAVTEFLKALNPDLNVTPNVFEPDKHSGRKRQRDIIIETTISEFIPLKILVSCKKEKKKLDENDIDTFFGNIDSSDASIGVIYSYSGFTKPAIINAKSRRIICCNLYKNRPPEIPEILLFQSYCCIPQIKLVIKGKIEPNSKIKKYNDLFKQVIENKDNITVIDFISDCWNKAEKKFVKENKEKSFYLQQYECLICSLKDENFDVDIFIIVSWKIFQGKIEANLLNGSYSYTEDKFVGQQISPVINLKGPEPGIGWELISKEKMKINSSYILIIHQSGDIKNALLKQLGKKKIQINPK